MSDCLVALRCRLFKFGLWSEAWRLTIGSHHLVSLLFQFLRIAALVINNVPTQFLFPTGCQLHVFRQQWKLQHEISRFLALLLLMRVQPFLHECSNDISPMLVWLILREDIWFQDLSGSRPEEFGWFRQCRPTWAFVPWGEAMWWILAAPRGTAMSRAADASTLTSSEALSILKFFADVNSQFFEYWDCSKSCWRSLYQRVKLWLCWRWLLA